MSFFIQWHSNGRPAIRQRRDNLLMARLSARMNASRARDEAGMRYRYPGFLDVPASPDSS
jgi:hypothetical protein